MKESRLFKIMYYLLEKGKSTAPELAERFEVSVRTIYRDIDVISSAGVPIYVTTGRNGGIQIAEDYVIDRLFLSDEEKDEILTALKSVAIAENRENDIISKLSSIFRVQKDHWLEVDFSRWGSKSLDSHVFETLKKGILTNTMLCITYANTRGEIKDRVICPIKLTYKAKSWYVKAYCLSKKDFRMFKLTRIINLYEVNRHFHPLRFPSENNEKEQQIQLQQIVLRFPQMMTYRVYDEFDVEEIRKDENDDFIVSTKLPVDDWLLGYLLSFGSNVQILEPEYLKNAVWKEAKKIGEYHKP